MPAAIALGLLAALVAFAFMGEDEAGAAPRPTPRPRPTPDEGPPPGDAEPPDDGEQPAGALPDDPPIRPGEIAEWTCDEIYNEAYDLADPDMLEEAARLLDLAECPDLAEQARADAAELRAAKEPPTGSRCASEGQVLYNEGRALKSPEPAIVQALQAMGCWDLAGRLNNYYSGL